MIAARFPKTLSLFLASLFFSACAAQPLKNTSGFVNSPDGVPIKYETKGSGEPALVFIHCWTCNRSFWDGQYDYFSKSHQVVRLDLAGHGESGLGRKNYSMSAFGGDVEAVVNKLGLKKVVLVGHSMGGPVAMEAEKRLGYRAEGVVGVDSFYTGFPYPTGSKIAEFVRPFSENFSAAAENMIRSMFPPTSNKSMVESMVKHFRSGNPEVAANAMTEVFVWAERDSAAAFKRTATKFRNINADPLSSGKPLHSSVVLVPRVGHFLAQENPAAFNQVLEEVLKTLN